MDSPLHEAPLFQLDSVESTQSFAADLLKRGEAVGGVLALEQTGGKGRFGRKWYSPPGECLAVSLVFTNYIGHHRPYLIGMSLAYACARALRAEVQWPNDVMFQGRKLGGILTELVSDDRDRLVPIVGIGVNLSQTSFPDEIADLATSIMLSHGLEIEPMDALDKILSQFESLPEIENWSSLAPRWARYDSTAGKKYMLQDGREGIAKSIGPEGELICDVDGKEERVLAADAILGPAAG